MTIVVVVSLVVVIGSETKPGVGYACSVGFLAETFRDWRADDKGEGVRVRGVFCVWRGGDRTGSLDVYIRVQRCRSVRVLDNIVMYTWTLPKPVIVEIIKKKQIKSFFLCASACAPRLVVYPETCFLVCACECHNNHTDDMPCEKPSYVRVKITEYHVYCVSRFFKYLKTIGIINNTVGYYLNARSALTFQAGIVNYAYFIFYSIPRSPRA